MNFFYESSPILEENNSKVIHIEFGATHSQKICLFKQNLSYKIDSCSKIPKVDLKKS